MRKSTLSRTLVAVLLATSCGGRDETQGGSGGVDGDWSGGGPVEDTDGGDGDGDGSGGDGGGDDRWDVGQGGSGGGSGEGDQGGCPCAGVLDGIYVLNSNAPASVWFYDPPENTFTEIGPLGCPAPTGAVANSMAIDRDGSAWFNYYRQSGGRYTGTMYRAPLSNLGECQDLNYAGGNGDWYLVGMGYAVRGATTTCDDLFVYNSDKYVQYPNFSGSTSQLGRWNPSASDKDILGSTNYPVAELTGTGDGRLYGFATVSQNQSVLVQFDKSDGSEIEVVPLDGLDVTSAFAFAFWGGDFFFFTQTTTGIRNSKVTRLDYDGNEDGGLTVVNGDTGLHITGAGVSTCASFVPPG